MVTILVISNTILALLLLNRCYKVHVLESISSTLAAMVHYNMRDAGSDKEKINRFSKLYDDAKEWNAAR